MDPFGGCDDIDFSGFVIHEGEEPLLGLRFGFELLVGGIEIELMKLLNFDGDLQLDEDVVELVHAEDS